MITIFAGGGEKEQRKESRRPIHTTQHQTSYGVQSAWPRKCGWWKLDHSCRGIFMRWYEWLHSDVRLCNQYWCNIFWPSGFRFYGLHHKLQSFTVVHVSYKLKINLHIYFILFYFNTCTLHLLLLCTMTNKSTINWQIITLLLHDLTLLWHPQGVHSQYLAKLHKYVNCSSW